MKVSGSVTGPDNWPKRWEDKSNALRAVNWNTFRRDPVLMEGIQIQHKLFDVWLERVRTAGVSPSESEDDGMGSPEGQIVDGYFTTADSLRQAYYAKTICSNWSLPAYFNVLDIGGGYGAFAQALRRRARLSYFALDAEPCLRMQKEFADAREWRAPRRIDLALNTNSFGEMDLDEVRRYFEIIETYLVDGGALYTQNRLFRVTSFSEYPYGPGWRHILVRHPWNEEGKFECLSVRDRNATSPHPATILQ